MNITEIQQAVGANPALLSEIASTFGKDLVPVIGQNDELIKGVLPVITQKGYVVRSKDDEQSFLNTFKGQVIESEIPVKIKEVHDKYDEDLFSLTGERKLPTEKTYDFLKRKISEIKSAQIADPVIKEQLKTLQSALEQKEAEHKKTVEGIEQKYFKREIDTLIGVGLDGISIAIPAHLKTDEEKQKYVASQKSMMRRDMIETLNAKKDNDGNVVFYEGEKPLTSTADGKPLTVSAIILNRYGYYIAKEEGQYQQGAGTGKGAPGGKTIYATKEELIAHLDKAGIKQGTTEFYAQYEKLSRESGLLK